MTDETRPDPLGCERCGKIGCTPFTSCAPESLPVNWQRECARLVEEQRAKAMEAAARVWARAQYGGDWMRVDFGQFAVERLANGKRPYAPADHAALEVLRAFEIVK